MNELPPGWAVADISTVTSNVTDGTHAPPPSALGGIPLLSAKDITDKGVRSHGFRFVSQDYFREEIERTSLAAGDVLLTIVGSIGRSAIVPTNPQFALQRSVAILKPSGVTPKFLTFYLRSPSAARYYAKYARGTAQLGLYLRYLKQLSVPVPPLSEQERIVAAIEEQFSRLDAGMAALSRARQNLKRMRAAALSCLLRDEDGADFPRVALGDVLVRGRYGTSIKCEVDGSGLPVLRIPNVQSGKIDLSDLKYAVDLSVDLSSTLAEEDDVLIIRTNGSRSLIGRAAVVSKIPFPVAFASYLIQLKTDPAKIYSQYLVAVLASPPLRVRLEELAATTAGQYNISLGKLRPLRIPLPEVAQQKKALTVAEGLLSRADQIDQEISRSLLRASQLRSSILGLAFAGALVSQCPADEPASVLLDRIAAERAPLGVNRRERPSRSHVTLEKVRS